MNEQNEQTKTDTGLVTLIRSLEAHRDRLAESLPSHISIDSFIAAARAAISRNPELIEADRKSLFQACQQAAADGLLPDGRQAVFNVYRTNVAKRGQPARYIPKVQYLPMVQGLIKVLYDSGFVSLLDAAAVYQRDTFRFSRGVNGALIHEPYLGIEDPGPVVAAYVEIKLKNGEVKREVMSQRDIEQVRSASKSSGEGSVWDKWYDQMAIKSVIKRAFKQMPHSPILTRIVASDNQAMGFTDIEVSAPAAEKPKAIARNASQSLDDFAGGPTIVDRPEPDLVDRKSPFKKAKPSAKADPKNDDHQDSGPAQDRPETPTGGQQNPVTILETLPEPWITEISAQPERAYSLLTSPEEFEGSVAVEHRQQFIDEFSQVLAKLARRHEKYKEKIVAALAMYGLELPEIE